MRDKFLLVIHAGLHEMERVIQGLTYGQGLYEAGYDVKIFFDGLGTQWIKELLNPEHQYHSLFKETLNFGIIEGACEFCSTFWNVSEDAKKAGIPLDGSGKDGHFNLADQIKEGYDLDIH